MVPARRVRRHREAANALAILLLQAGDPHGAEPWFSKAAEAGSVDAAFNLGILHAGRGDDRTALGWYERAAAAGHTEAALQVGIARLRDGDEREAERHLRCAAGGGSAEAAFRLATVLDARQPPPEPHTLGRRGRRRPSARSGTSGRPSRGTAGPR